MPRCYARFEKIFGNWDVTISRDGRVIRELRLISTLR